MAQQESLVSLYNATEDRLAGEGPPAVLSALLSKSTDDLLVRALAIFFEIGAIDPTMPSENFMSLAIAKAHDQEGTAGDDPKFQAIADFIRPQLSSMTGQAIPRSLLQYLGQSLKAAGDYPTRLAAVQYLLDNYTFVGEGEE